MNLLDVTTPYKDTDNLFLGEVFTLYDDDFRIKGYDIYHTTDGQPRQEISSVWMNLENVYALRDWLNKVLPDPNQPTNVIELFSDAQEILDNLSILGRKSGGR